MRTDQKKITYRSKDRTGSTVVGSMVEVRTLAARNGPQSLKSYCRFVNDRPCDEISEAMQ